MTRLLWKSLLVSPAVLGATLVVSSATFATENKAATEVMPTQTAEAAVLEAQPVALATTTEAQSAKQTEVLSARPAAEALSEVAPAQEKSVTETSAEIEIPQQVAATTAPTAEVLKEGQPLQNLQSLPTTPAEVQSKQLAITPAPSAENLQVEMSNGASLSVGVPGATKVEVSQAIPGDVPPANPTDASTLDQINRYSREGGNNAQGQVTNVSQLSDVRPTDWAYEALRSLVERYGCIAGYPDGTYRGNRAMSRYEFAAGLNSCLTQIEKLIAASTADFVTKEDLATLQRLVDEFSAELATLRTRVDNLEGRVRFLEDHQFSTTTKLVGEAIFALTDEVGTSVENNTIFGDRVRLELQTSFTGRDILHTRLAAGNLGAFNLDNSGTFEGNQTFNLGNTGNNDIILDWLAYEFPFGASTVYVAATGGLHADYAPVLNPYFYNGDGGNGSLSTFAQQSPIYRIGGGAGLGVRLGVGKAPLLGPTSLTLGYLADNANNPAEDFGLANGDYSALAQLNFTIADRIGIGATYVHGYHNRGNAIFDIGGVGRNTTGIVGTSLANLPSTLGPVVSNSYGIEAAFRLGPVSISGFGMFSDIIAVGDGDGEVWSYGAGIAFPDLGKKGNVLGLFAGREPYLGNIDINGSRVRISNDESWHFEGFYKYQLTDNVSITPGVIWITNPNQNSNNEDAIIGTLRTTFTF